MTRLDRYLLRTVLLGGFGAVIAFTLLALIFQFIDEVDRVSETYTLAKVLTFVALSIPGYIYDFYPVAILIGVLLSLGALASGSELTVMRASGMSILRMARPVLLGGVLLAFFGMLIGETLGPWGQETARKMRAEATESALSVNTRSGLWVRDGMRFVNARRAVVGGQLLDVKLFEFDSQGRLIRSLTAARAEVTSQDRWNLYEVAYTDLTADKTVAVTQPLLEAQRLFPARMLDVAVVYPQHMSLLDLIAYVQHLEQNDLDSTPYRIALWMKAFTPLSVVAVLVLAMPFVFASQRGGNAGQWLFVGIMLGVVYITFNRIMNFMGPVYGVPAILSASLPPLIFLILGLVALSRLNPAARFRHKQ
ncbi:MAG TPA: LPS export ABC transporter permease LptG [Halothiobacillus sp.]|nr:LPS export ABC transporter permease LptG [Halothiobacillus sp.]